MLVLGARHVRGSRGHEVAQVRVLVGRFSLARGDPHDHKVPELLIRPRHQVGQPGLLDCFAAGNGQRIALPRVAVPADL
jgi:hypothetical protein